MRILFLGGLGRSGTTLVERVLGELPGVCALGEVVHLWRRDVRDDERCGCGVRFSSCEFWTAVGDIAFGGWRHVDTFRVLALQRTVERTRHIPWLAATSLAGELVLEYVDYFARVYAAAAQVTGARVIIDSSKHASLAFCLRWAPGLDLRVAHVVRDPRGVAYSWTKHVPRPEADDSAAMTRYTPARSALLWNAHNAAFGLLRRCGVPVRRVRYEQFLADPRAEVQALGQFAGFDLTAADLSYVDSTHAELRPGHSAAGNPMRYSVGRVPLHPDNAWRSALPDRHRRLVGALTAPLLTAYGYPLRTPRES